MMTVIMAVATVTVSNAASPASLRATLDGNTIQVVGTEFPSSVPVSLEYDFAGAVTTKQATSNADGRFDASLAVPAGFVGRVTIIARCKNTKKKRASVTPATPVPTTTATSTPTTAQQTTVTSTTMLASSSMTQPVNPVGTPTTATKPAGGPVAGRLPAKIVATYEETYEGPAIADVETQAPEYNLHYYSSAKGTNNGGTVAFQPVHDDPATLKAQIKASQAKGDKWLITLAGAGDGGGVVLKTDEHARQMTDSVKAIVAEYGFDGVDLNFEGNSDRIGLAQWTPQAAATFAKMIKEELGQDFLVSSAPRPWEDYQREFAVLAGDNIDLLGYQFYDIPELNDPTYLKNHIMERIDQSVAMGIPASKLVIGARIDGEAGNHGDIATYVEAWKAVEAKYPDIRGVFIWNSRLDSTTGWQFAKQMGTAVL